MAPVVVTTVFALLVAVAVVLVALLVTGRDGSPVTFLGNLRRAMGRQAQPAGGRTPGERVRRPGFLAEMRELAEVEDGDVDDLFRLGRPAPGYLETTELHGAVEHARRVAVSAAGLRRARD